MNVTNILLQQEIEKVHNAISISKSIDQRSVLEQKQELYLG